MKNSLNCKLFIMSICSVRKSPIKWVIQRYIDPYNWTGRDTFDVRQSALNCPSERIASPESAQAHYYQVETYIASFGLLWLVVNLQIESFITKNQFFSNLPVTCETIKLTRISSQLAYSSTLAIELGGNDENNR